MLIHRYKSSVLIALSVFAVSACGTLSPTHEGKFTFRGRVTTPDGKPIPNAWVKVRGWETLTDASGKWTQVQIVHCGTEREHPGSFDESDQILITATGFESSEEKFLVKHPAYFVSCESEQTIAFDTVLKPEDSEKKANREASKFKPAPEPSAIPWPKEDGTRKRRGTTL
jgi:hypothetical protein